MLTRQQFIDAYAGEDPAAYIFNEFAAACADYWSDWTACETWRYNAWVQHGLGNDHEALGWLIAATDYLAGAVFALNPYGWGLATDYLMLDMLYLSHYCSEIGWRSLVKAMGLASLPGMMWIVTTIDELRQTMYPENPEIKWNENLFEY